MRTLTIQLDNDTDDDQIIVARIIALMKQGFTSGSCPNWAILEEKQ